MPYVSTRGQRLPSSPIRKLVPFAEAAKARGTKVYHLNIGQPDIPTPPSALQAVRDADISVLAYSHSAGNESYRRKLAEYYATFGVEIDHHNVLVTAGASEAIQFTIMSCLDPEDEIIVPEPFYANYNGFALAGNVNVVPVTAVIEDGFALPPIPDFEDLITPRTRAILICNPSNPTGYLYTRHELEQLRDLCLKHNLFLMVDEVYREFVYGQEHTSVLALEGLEMNAIVFDSISKRYSACGARIGCVVTRNQQVYDTIMKFAQARLSPPTLAQILAEATLDVGPEYLEEAIAEYANRRELLVARLRAMDGVVCPEPGGAFYLFARFPVDDTENFCRWLLESFEHEGATLMMAPGEGFYSTAGLGRQAARLAYVLNEADINAAMDVLQAALLAYPGRTPTRVPQEMKSELAPEAFELGD